MCRGDRKDCWLLLSTAMCSMPWKFMSAGSGYCTPSALPKTPSPPYLTVGSLVGTLWSHQNLEKQSDVNTRVLKASSRADSGLLVTVW